MLRRDKAYSFLGEIGVPSGKRALNKINKLEFSDEVYIGALSGTALAALTMLATKGKYEKKVALDKKLLDDTYTPFQRSMANKLEKLNREIITKETIGNSLGSIAGLGVTLKYSHRLMNEALGVSIGGKIGKSISSLIIRNKINEYKDLLLEYEESLSYEQKKLRLELMKSTSELGVVWTLGCIGGLVSGAIIGNQIGKL